MNRTVGGKRFETRWLNWPSQTKPNIWSIADATQLTGKANRPDSEMVLRLSRDFQEDPVSPVASVCRTKLEGIIGKRGDAPYRSERARRREPLNLLARCGPSGRVAEPAPLRRRRQHRIDKGVRPIFSILERFMLGQKIELFRKTQQFLFRIAGQRHGP
ncbi:hypothetical protein HDG34_007601 [Paraburkholderia sp. HC6.4b]|uniref:hypothetical protein n=1 Tax=unclassified Paraburkholderia TaxID=2615204 RepID=UPI0016196385|nr:MULTISPECIES: hypothetical protein [unclassified Paraburkholderia]MBB5413623.1 hypothetical protein [Paraburkholderia sp. HC6.4b]MBB5456017.1 hypothetical protein [Paraburkholderia sp. Kb1A]